MFRPGPIASCTPTYIGLCPAPPWQHFDEVIPLPLLLLSLEQLRDKGWGRESRASVEGWIVVPQQETANKRV